MIVQTIRRKPILTSIAASVALVCSFVPGMLLANEDVRGLLQGLQSPSCETRRTAIATYLGSSDNRAAKNAALRSATEAGGQSRERVAALLQIIDDDREGAARIASLAEQISRVAALPPAGQASQLVRYRDELLKLTKDPSEKFTARVGAPWLLTRVLRAGADSHPDWIPGWRKELDEMLRSKDDALRVLAAINAALGRFPEGNDPRAFDVVRVLIGGLGSDSSVVREMSYTGLAQVAPSGPCFEATDPPNLRAAEVVEWEAWLTKKRPTLEAQQLKQSFF